MIIRAGGEIRRLLQLSLKVDSFLLQLTVVSHFFKEVVKGNDLGAMWEARLVVSTAKEEAAWERGEIRLLWEVKGAKWESMLVCRI